MMGGYEARCALRPAWLRGSRRQGGGSLLALRPSARRMAASVRSPGRGWSPAMGWSGCRPYACARGCEGDGETVRTRAGWRRAGLLKPDPFNLTPPRHRDGPAPAFTACGMGRVPCDTPSVSSAGEARSCPSHNVRGTGTSGASPQPASRAGLPTGGPTQGTDADRPGSPFLSDGAIPR